MIEIVESDDEEHNMRKKVKERIGKRLAYLLRYGAFKEGLKTAEGGYVKLNDLLDTSLLKQNYYSNSDSNNNNNNKHSSDRKTTNDVTLIMEELKTSISHRNINRFELKQINNETYVRATYGRKFERSPFHTGSKVKRLLEISLDYIVKNINSYDFEGFPDEFLIK
jgi:RNA:NAD 2'-phosphotransferase (TPT1/KptA family)